MVKLTVEEYKKRLMQEGYSQELVDKYFENMPLDSTNGRNRAKRLLSENTKNKNGKDIFKNNEDQAIRALESDGRSGFRQRTDFQAVKSGLERDIHMEGGGATLRPGLNKGYGNGMMGASRSSRMDHVKNIPRAVLGSGDALANAFGILTPTQKLQSRTGSLATRMINASIPLGVTGFSAMQMMSGEDPMDIVSTNLSFAAGMTGFRVGKAVGGAVTRGLGGIAAGGALGFTAAMVGTQAVFDGAKDLTSNESEIAKIAKSVYTRESMANMRDSRESLTLRGRTLEKLSSSGMNDRRTLLGNEALVMKNLM
jgi:hypothetical protein